VVGVGMGVGGGGEDVGKVQA
jgi:hypothetical protein